MKKNLAIIIAARNEGLVIDKTLKAISKVVSKSNIYLISDASTDNTAEEAYKVISAKNVLTNQSKMGKSNSLNRGIEEFKLVSKYKYVMPVDADTVITKEMVDGALEEFEKSPAVVAVVGRIKSEGNNYISSYRNWEYELGHTIIKKAQSYLNVITVCSGCATVYRTEVFEKMGFVEDTLTEDTDFTFTIHRKKMGRIVFVDKGAVYTQDPNSLKAITKQLTRWYSGFWQNVLKHNVPWGGQMLDFEVTLIALSAVSNGLITLAGGFLFIAGIFNPVILRMFLQQFVIDIFLLMIPTIAYTAYKNKNWRIFTFLPHIYFLRVYSVLIFMHCFTKVMFGKDAAQWDRTQRYKYLDKKVVVFSE
jgi:cellulose synthase/poly-beta-1,6-N-acetylglucosamine synthase-like glycosyltransferase